MKPELVIAAQLLAARIVASPAPLTDADRMRAIDEARRLISLEGGTEPAPTPPERPSRKRGSR